MERGWKHSEAKCSRKDIDDNVNNGSGSPSMDIINDHPL